MKTQIKTLAAGLTLLSLPMAAFAGGSHVWQKMPQGAQPELAGVVDHTAPARVLSSTDLGMHYAHGPGKDSKSNRISIPGTVYTLEDHTEKSHPFNKRALIMELKEDQLKDSTM